MSLFIICQWLPPPPICYRNISLTKVCGNLPTIKSFPGKCKVSMLWTFHLIITGDTSRCHWGYCGSQKLTKKCNLPEEISVVRPGVIAMGMLFLAVNWIYQVQKQLPVDNSKRNIPYIIKYSVESALNSIIFFSITYWYSEEKPQQSMYCIFNDRIKSI